MQGGRDFGERNSRRGLRLRQTDWINCRRSPGRQKGSRQILVKLTDRTLCAGIRSR